MHRGSVRLQFKLTMDKGLNPEQIAELTKLATTTAQENIGMPMVYSVTEAVKEWLLANNVDAGVRVVDVVLCAPLVLRSL